MSHITDLIGFINAKSGTSFTEGQLTVGVPAAIEGAQSGQRNTSVEVSGVPAQGFNGTKTINYFRLDLAETFAGVVGGLNAKGPRESGRSADVLDDIFVQTGVQLEASDIVDEAVDFSAAGTYILKAAPGNLKWIGQVEVAITMDLVDINTMITDGDVDGFVAPTLS